MSAAAFVVVALPLVLPELLNLVLRDGVFGKDFAGMQETEIISDFQLAGRQHFKLLHDKLVVDRIPVPVQVMFFLSGSALRDFSRNA
ncbi:MAG: hypothetical protein FD123_1460 [Bacteroidetes bacterium]|nr:MAG: hypothetical protein FD123_1460 [Bacteroidota bacterium]